MLEFAERFFKLTLDNVYRFVCSVLFVVAMTGQIRSLSPSGQLQRLLDWLGVPSAWLLPVGQWLGSREGFVAAVAGVGLLVSLVFAAADEFGAVIDAWSQGRAGSTALLAIALLIQVDQGSPVWVAAVVCFAGLIVLTGGAVWIARRMGAATPMWPGAAWGKFGNVIGNLLLAAAYIISPIGWLLSHEPYRRRGTIVNPI